MTDFPDLETERLLLRHFTAQDIEFVFRHFSDPRVAEFLLDEPPVADRAQAQAIIDFYLEQDGKSYNRWLIERKADHQPIGTCGFHKWARSQQRAEIGYDLSPAAWGQGYMSEAVRCALVHGFGPMGLHRVEALVAHGNERSVRLLKRFGFQQEGLLRDYFCLNGRFYDHYLFSLLRGEWDAIHT